jgi:hypothetical protein
MSVICGLKRTARDRLGLRETACGAARLTGLRCGHSALPWLPFVTPLFRARATGAPAYAGKKTRT